MDGEANQMRAMARGDATATLAGRGMIGRVSLVKGAHAELELTPAKDAGGKRAPTVGTMLGIRGDRSTIIALVSEIALYEHTESVYSVATVDLVGELRSGESGDYAFRRGVQHYPLIGDGVVLLDKAELEAIYGGRSKTQFQVGRLHQYAALPARVDANELLNKHFAILGSTGVGKSSGVALILSALLKAKPDLRVFLIDSHNEYGSCFGEDALTLTPSTFRLPFWLFSFDEILEVIYRGRPRSNEEVEILADLIPEAKRSYAQRNRGQTVASYQDVTITTDTPVPYRMSDLLGLVQERMGKLEHQASRGVYRKLLRRVAGVANDPRYAFVFDAANVGGDTMASTLRQVFPLPGDQHRITIMQLAGIPNEATNAVVSVLGRLAFDVGLWSDGALPLLFVCEEAHRYAPSKTNTGFAATQRSIARIAKEGRKYGVFLGVVSQRPAELDQTILAQCSTFFVMRLTNEADQSIIRAAVTDAGSTLLDFIPSLSTREVFAFGEGVKLPTRLEFDTLPPERRPRPEASGNEQMEPGRIDASFYDTVVAKWRSVSGNQPRENAEGENQRNTRPLDPGRYSILKKSPPLLGA